MRLLSRFSSGEHPSKQSDWSHSPAAMFACGVLGLASIGGLAWSLNRAVEQDSQSSTIALQAESVEKQSVDKQRDPKLQSPDPRSLSAIKRIDINAAGLAELDLLPGIGPALASRIIDDRDENGLFESIDDLERVKGIGPKTVEKLRALAIISDSLPIRASVGEDG